VILSDPILEMSIHYKQNALQKNKLDISLQPYVCAFALPLVEVFSLASSLAENSSSLSQFSSMIAINGPIALFSTMNFMNLEISIKLIRKKSRKTTIMRKK